MMSRRDQAGRSGRCECERGVALVVVLLGFSVVTVLGLGLTGLGIVTTTMAVSESETAEALAIADAGVSHARKLILWQEWASFDHFLQNGSGTACDGDELADAPSGVLPPGYPSALADFIPADGRTFGGGSYRVFVCDDDVTDADPTTGALDMDPDVDVNKRILIRSFGTGRNGATAAVEVLIGVQDLPAVIVDGGVVATGTPRFMGSAGAVHANGTMLVAGNACAEQSFSAVGDITVSGASAGGGATCSPGDLDTRPDSPPLTVPVLSPDSYKPAADYWLEIDGSVYDGTSGLPLPGLVGWSFSASSKTWQSNSKIPGGTYWINGNVIVGGSPGESTPLPLTLLARGYVDVGGNPRVVPDLVVTDLGATPVGITAIAGTDVRLAGTSTVVYAGVYYATHQLDVSGTPTINGQLLARNRADAAYPAGTATNIVSLDAMGRMVMSGSPTVTFGGSGVQGARALRWRECRAAASPTDPCGPLFGGS